MLLMLILQSKQIKNISLRNIHCDIRSGVHPQSAHNAKRQEVQSDCMQGVVHLFAPIACNDYKKTRILVNSAIVI